MRKVAIRYVPLDAVCDYFHIDRTKLAKGLGVSRSAVSKMAERRHIPMKHCLAIERISGGVISAEHLCEGRFVAIQEIED